MTTLSLFENLLKFFFNITSVLTAANYAELFFKFVFVNCLSPLSAINYFFQTIYFENLIKHHITKPHYIIIKYDKFIIFFYHVLFVQTQTRNTKIFVLKI